MKNKIIKRHSDGSVTTLGEALDATFKGFGKGFLAGSIAVLGGMAGAVLLERSLTKDN
jgi:hypothetical protein